MGPGETSEWLPFQVRFLSDISERLTNGPGCEKASSQKYAYADELTLLYASQDWEDALRQTTLLGYLQAWRLKLSNTKTVTAAFHLNNKEAKRELDVYNWQSIATLFSPNMSWGKAGQIALLRRLAGWGAGAKTVHISAISFVYCAPVWCRSTHTHLINSILNDALRIVTGCLCPTPTEDLPVLGGVQPAELRRLGATFSLANRAIHDFDHVLHGQQNAHQGRL